MGAPIVIERSTLITGMVVGLFVALVAASIRIDALEAQVTQLYALDRCNRVAAAAGPRPCAEHSISREPVPPDTPSWFNPEYPPAFEVHGPYPPDVGDAPKVNREAMPPEAMVNREALAAFFERQEVPDPAKVVLSTVPREHAKSSP